MCSRNFNQANFSQKQLTDVRYQLSTRGQILTNPRCLKCTGQPLVELECFMCHKTKGLEAFAKSQRQDTDNAVRILCDWSTQAMLTASKRCLDCTMHQTTRQPINEANYDEPGKAFVRTERSGGYPDYFATTNSTRDTASIIVSPVQPVSAYCANLPG